MPLYDYQCKDCQSRQEAFRKIVNRGDNPVCLQCGGDRTGRIVNAQIRREEPIWLDSATDNLRPEAKQIVQDRSSFNKYLKERNLIQTG